MIFWRLFFAVAAASAEETPVPAIPARATLDSQDIALKALLQGAPKLALEPTAIQGWTAGRVSWIAMDQGGRLYLLQRGDQADPVIVIDQQGRILRSWGKGLFRTPHAVRIDRQGHVWTVDAGNSMVYEFSAEGRILRKISVGGLPSPRTRFCGATDIAFAPNGHLFVADGYRNARIIEFGGEGQRLRQWGTAGAGPGQFHLPHAIQIDENGVIYVADRENGRIERFDPTGRYLGEWARYGKTFGMKLAGGVLWVSSYPRGGNDASGWLLKIDRASGSLLGYIETTSGHGIDVTPGGEILAAAPAADENPIWYRRRSF